MGEGNQRTEITRGKVEKTGWGGNEQAQRAGGTELPSQALSNWDLSITREKGRGTPELQIKQSWLSEGRANAELTGEWGGPNSREGGRRPTRVQTTSEGDTKGCITTP